MTQYVFGDYVHCSQLLIEWSQPLLQFKAECATTSSPGYCATCGTGSGSIPYTHSTACSCVGSPVLPRPLSDQYLQTVQETLHNMFPWSSHLQIQKPTESANSHHITLMFARLDREITLLSKRTLRGASSSDSGHSLQWGALGLVHTDCFRRTLVSRSCHDVIVISSSWQRKVTICDRERSPFVTVKGHRLWQRKVTVCLFTAQSLCSCLSPPKPN